MDQFILNVNTAILSSNIMNPIIVYVGVGTAAGTYVMRGNNKYVEPQNYHQYPKALRDMESILQQNVKKYILLIDPCMEEIPHITQDKENGFNFVKESDNVYVDYSNQIFLQVLRENVTHDAYSKMAYGNHGINITEDLTRLIEICKTKYCNFVYHDFSGRPLLPLYNFYEGQIGDNINHIVIGFGAQGDFGCYFDLTSPVGTFAMKLDVSPNRRSFINICSPRHYLNKGYSIECALRDYPNCNHEVLREQFTRICKDKFDELVSRVFYKLRFLKKIQEKKDIKIDELEQLYGESLGKIIMEQIQEKNYEIAFIEALEFYGPQYDYLCLNNKLDFLGVDLLYKITSDAKDEYSWATELRKYVNY
jgi:hypothetical protein